MSEAKVFAESLQAQNGLNVKVDCKNEIFGPISKPNNADLRVHDIGNLSGIYFLTQENGNVAYIGKATKDNLHAELWGKLRTPVEDGSISTYPNTYWSKSNNLDKKLKSDLLMGKINIRAIVIEPAMFSSLFEVFLQTYHYSQEGRLPALNSQIG